MPKRFTLEFLNEICCEKGITLFKNYSEDELNGQTFIDFKCIKHQLKEWLNDIIICKNQTNKL